MTIPLYQVDSFTDKPFAGNPAAVCLLETPADAAWMQSVAAEMNLSETAFVSPAPNGFHLRWFTPATEVDLCGHATLAAAHILWETGRLPAWETARFHTKSGLITCERQDTPSLERALSTTLSSVWIRMDFPATLAQPADPPAALLAALGSTKLEFAGRSRFDYLLVLPTEAAVRGLSPNFAALAGVPDVRGVIATASSQSPEFDFVSRFFAPAVGVPEDPVTGSAHCALTPYWAERLKKTDMVAWQASKRGGCVRVSFAGDRVYLAGQAVTVLRGTLLD